jgi:predicted ATP-dependent protease
MNQAGAVQPIGGVNEKIEGFFDVCHARGLTGTQGVLVPAANVPDLMLHPRVLEACRAGRFRVYPVATIDQGIEILTGIAAGEIRGKRYPTGTLYGQVDLRLRKFAAMMRDFGGGHP